MGGRWQNFTLNGLDCANCAAKIEENIKHIDGICDVSLNFATQNLSVKIDEKNDERQVLDRVKKVVNDIEPDVNMQSLSNRKQDEQEEESASPYRLLTAVFIYIIALFLPDIAWLKFTAFFAAYILAGFDVLWRAVRNVFSGAVFDESFLMSVATIGAFAIRQFAEGVAVMLFYQIGVYFENKAVDHSRRSIKELMDIRPDYANLKIGDSIKEVNARDININDTIVVKAGERIPLDGKIKQGHSFLDTSPLTGESVLREVQEGDDVLAGSINKYGLLEVEVSQPFENSTVSRVLEMVEKAAGRKASTEKFITRFARYYTPIVVFGALLIAFIPPLVISDALLGDWVYRALVFLVVSCPCALVLSIPLSFFSGIGAASRQGILVKGGNYLEALGQIKAVVFDKTGTLTEGAFKVVDVKATPGHTEEDVLKFAAIAESRSDHPIAVSIMEEWGRSIDDLNIEDYEEIAGLGVKAIVNGQTILAGNARLMDKYSISYNAANEPGTVVYVAVNGSYIGNILIDDIIKEDAAEVIRKLKKKGIRVYMLTGDHENAAHMVAEKLGLDGYFAELLPDEKVEKLEQLQKSLGNERKLAFVGDGINDAPVLARADVGIAMGKLGTDAAMEAADIVLMNDGLSSILTAMEIASYTQHIAYQNIIFALGIKAAVLILAAMGIASMWVAVFADVGVSIIAVLNSLRIARRA